MVSFARSRPEPESTVPSGVRAASEWSWRLLAIVALAAVVVYLVTIFSDIVIPLLVALLVTALLQPTVASLIRRHWPKWLAILVCLVAFAAVVAGLVLLVVWQVRAGLPRLEHESVAAYDRARSALRQPPWNVSDRDFAGYISSAGQMLQRDSGALVGGAVRVGSTAGHLLAGTLIALFATIFLLIDGGGIWRWITRLLPRNGRPALQAGGEAGWRTLTSFVRVQILVAVVNGVGIGLVAFFLGLPLAIPIGVIVLLASFIPVIGAIVSGIIAVAIALVFAGPVQALIMLAGVLLVHLLEAHVMQPLLVGGAVKVHPLAVVVAVAAGTGIAGVAGALFAVPLIAVGNAMVSAMLRTVRGRPPANDPGPSPVRAAGPDAPPGPARAQAVIRRGRVLLVAVASHWSRSRLTRPGRRGRRTRSAPRRSPHPPHRYRRGHRRRPPRRRSDPPGTLRFPRRGFPSRRGNRRRRGTRRRAGSLRSPGCRLRRSCRLLIGSVALDGIIHPCGAVAHPCPAAATLSIRSLPVRRLGRR
ncbi:AI-2E family transporter [Leifsonia sp. SIMBA_070]|uniref:AI-2E family transporter n=1 Tax=Leifsonia sp. SIMBA_070 TaxID=3085810 RepID=UPI00397C63B2